MFLARLTADTAMGAGFLVLTNWTVTESRGFASFTSGVLTIARPGLYRITAVGRAASAPNLFFVRHHNAAGDWDYVSGVVAGGAGTLGAHTSALIRAAAGDTLRLYVGNTAATWQANMTTLQVEAVLA